MTYYLVSFMLTKVKSRPDDGAIDITLADPIAGILGMIPLFGTREQAEAWRGDSDAQIFEVTV